MGGIASRRFRAEPDLRTPGVAWRRGSALVREQPIAGVATIGNRHRISCNLPVVTSGADAGSTLSLKASLETGLVGREEGDRDRERSPTRAEAGEGTIIA